MNNNDKNEKKSTPLAVKILAGFLALLMLSGTVFGFLYYVLL